MTERQTPLNQIGPDSLTHELVPLGLATRVVAARAYGSDAAAAATRLTGIAHTMAALVPLYVYATDGSDVRRVTEDELRSGFFRKDGGELHFTDGRVPCNLLAVTHGAIEHVARLLASTRDRSEATAR